jgi:diguanylate cyclase (GGDEF)-like protein
MVETAQQIRLQRLAWGAVSYGVAFAISVACYLTGILSLSPLIIFGVSIVFINYLFLMAILTGFNLRFKDPSLTEAQVVSACLPTIYIMYFITDPQARMAFLLMATVAMLYGVLSLDFRRMLVLGGMVFLTYLLLLAALFAWAPERVDMKIEVVIIFAYSVVLELVAYVGSFIAGLRKSLRERNRSLQRAMTELEKLARIDPLTRLPNRRSVMEQIEKEQARAQRRVPERNNLCICIMDIDFFKKVNDNYGHQVGDLVLQRISETLQKILRKGEFVGRYGGEEFLMIFPETTYEGARAASQRIRRAIAEMIVPELEKQKGIIVSIGVATYQPGNDINETINNADKALYQAKSHGRNRVCMAPISEK